jgi:hypothetical protein
MNAINNLAFFSRHPIATFHIKTNNTFAIWDLNQRGHPRHVGFDVELPKEPWSDVCIHWNRSKWIFVI